MLLARDVPVGLIVRRGPSKTYCTIGWDRRRDTFEVGQWMRGRIYERRADLSPDGRHFVYFAMNGRWNTQTKGSWTAISRAPYVKALTLLAKGDCWHGGGLFTDRGKVWINQGYGHKALRQAREVEIDTSYHPSASFGGECPGVYYVRLQRDGWVLRSMGRRGDPDVFEKLLPYGYVLRKIAHAEVGAPPGKGCYWDSHELPLPERTPPIDASTWEWADLDGTRLVYTEGGKLMTRALSKKGIGEAKLLHDFSDMSFEALRAPY